MDERVSRRTLLRLAGATGVAAVAGPSATGAAVAVPNDDYETPRDISLGELTSGETRSIRA